MRAGFAVLLLGLSANLLAATPGQIHVSGQGEVLLDPDSAGFEISITTRGATSAAAAQDNARVTQDVRNALDRVRLPREDLRDSRLSVSARWDYDPAANRQKLVGYEARNILRIRTGRIDATGAVIDAALLAGASGVSEPVYESRELPDARRRALALAVADARLDAQALAKASGGNLGALLQMSADPAEGPVFPHAGDMRVAMMAAAPQPTQPLPGKIRVVARVSAQWQYEPSEGAR
ncbi:MAG: hypothetical protein RLZZ200_3183 [Pseudomonadota bacterium]|jgi:uncharacterized protein YggE